MTNDLDFLTFIANRVNSTHDSIYCVIDNSGTKDAVRHLDLSNLSWVSLLQGSKEEGALAVAPLLVQLSEASATSAGRGFLRWLSGNCTFNSTLIFLETALPMEELKNRLVARLNGKITDDMDVLIRYFDPRVLPILHKVLDEVERQNFFSPARVWWYIDRGGILKEIHADYSASEVSYALTLNPAQEHEMLQASEIDQIIDGVANAVGDRKFGINFSNRHLFVQEHTEIARKFNIVETNDLIVYCTLALFYGNSFTTMEPWEGMLKTFALRGMSFSSAAMECSKDLTGDLS